MLYITVLGDLLDKMDCSSAQEEIKVTCFGYRKSHVAGEKIARLPRELMRDFESCLAARADAQPDNHTGYLIESNGESFFVYCSDSYMYFTTGYELGVF